MSENGMVAMKAFAAQIDVDPHTVSDIVEKLGLETGSMTNGRAKGLPPKTQRIIKRLLNIKPATAHAASA